VDDAVKAEPNPEENEVGFAPQTDNNFLTFFAQSALPGLKVRTAEGEWIPGRRRCLGHSSRCVAGRDRRRRRAETRRRM
jgi:hypothetical protein